MRHWIAAASLLVALPLWAADAPAVVPPFALAGLDGRPLAVPTPEAGKPLVVLFLGTNCPINVSYLPRLAELHREFAPRGVAFVGVNSNSYDAADKVKALLTANPLPFPVGKDANNRVADLFGAERVPEAFVLDGARRVAYRGRIDDQYGFDYKRAKPTRRDVAEALTELLDGKPVTVARTAVEGCRISRMPAAAPATGAVTFTKHVSRVLQARCQECHRDGQAGPMPLVSYEDAAAWAPMMREVIDAGRMPPWHADPKHGTFANARSLPEEEKRRLFAWIDAGCPKGDAADAPPPKAFADGWTIGQPDAVFAMKSAFDVPAQMPKGGVPYKYFVVPTSYAEDRWVQAAEAKPGAKEVVHHIIVYVKRPGDRQNREDNIGDGLLATYAPGDLPSVYPAGYAKKLPKGATLVFQMHYTPDGVARTDKSQVAVTFSKEPPKVEVRTRSIPNTRLSIPPGESNYLATSRGTFRQDTELLTLLPHMHLRGKDFKYEAVYPDGRREVLLSVPRYDFNWQASYRLASPLKLPAGTRVECTAHFDNSAGNKNNPDPSATVRWGDQTWQEMMIGFADYAVLPEAK